MNRKRTRIVLLLLTALAGFAAGAAEPFDAERAKLVREVERHVTETSRYTGVSRLSPAVLDALAAVPRHEFVPADVRRYAYLDRPLPIGAGQTISQPYIVALMTHLASIDDRASVLEIGTGSGYQAAVLGEIAANVYSIEIVEPLGRRAAATLRRLGYDKVRVRIGDGYRGWPEHAPYDAIIVTAAPETVPQPLIEQLRVGGRLVVPVGPVGGPQSLQVLTKREDGEVVVEDVLPVIFVPFTRDEDD